jgi:hypothetical protein
MNRKGTKGNFGTCMNRKGIILTLDFLLAMVITFIILAVAIGFFSSATALPSHQAQLIGSDIVTILENEGRFNVENSSMLEESIRTILPNNYQMALRIKQNSSTIAVGSIPGNVSVISGERVSLTSGGTYRHVTYFIWGKT